MRLPLILLLLSIWATSVSAQLKVHHLRCEDAENPLGIETAKPQLSWQLLSKERGQRQTAFRILVADSPQQLDAAKGNLWDSGKQLSDESIQIAFSGANLKPGRKYYWKVMAWDKAGKPSEWSQPAFWRMGLPDKTDWGNAQWIGMEKIAETDRIVPGIDSFDKLIGKPAPASNVLPQFRRQVLVRKKIKAATAYISGLGQFEFFLNGKKVGDHVLDPGWTEYSKVAQYVTFDLTSQIRNGENAFGVMLGNGFYNIPNERYKKLVVSYGYPMFIAKILLEYTDGSFENVVSDLTWKATQSPITFSSVFGGEDYNATLEKSGWTSSGFNDQTWQTPVAVQGPPRLSSQLQDPIKIHEIFTAKIPVNPKKGIWVYDLGQNISGFPQLTVKGKRGASVKITPAELLTSDKLANQQAVGSPVFFTYTLRGTAPNGQQSETWHPQFTYYGFRYIQIEGAVPVDEPNPEGLPVIEDVKGLHTRASAPQAGSFSSSSVLFNEIDTLIDWSIRSNMASILTDCPHREKLGWLEVAHLMGSSMHYKYDVSRYFAKIVQDMQQSQTAEGLIPSVAPEYPRFPGAFRDSPEWGSASVILPWYLYKWYGNKQLLTESYPMMRAYISYLESKSKDGILMHGLGDWYDLGPKDPGSPQLTPAGVTATAVYYYDLSIMAQTAKLLGKSGEAENYERIAQIVKQAFNKKFFNEKVKNYATNSQTANAMALYMGLVEPKDQQAVTQSLITGIRARNNSLSAGDVGFRYLLLALQQAGASEVIYDMNSRTDVPGYGYQLKKGATALTESWQANTNASNNHMMLGHLMEWFYSGLSGIQDAPSSVASKEVIIHPELVGDITSVDTHYDSPYGRISVQCEIKDNMTEMNVEIPVNSSAVIYIPSPDPSKVTEGDKPVSGQQGIVFVEQKDGKSIFKIGSGSYRFKAKK
ncbi:alpha-L-rhamnosidase [Dyadobacter sp. 3J3]|uniref:alpha-L-rhamnosidase n=1 Tax=Dyadobacter sp. 3J3 TaxID=2606600 RepID=UPI001357E33B|nr:alpha-L-rhamnosidase [Dyadobacter sp. 3J3]